MTPEQQAEAYKELNKLLEWYSENCEGGTPEHNLVMDYLREHRYYFFEDDMAQLEQHLRCLSYMSTIEGGLGFGHSRPAATEIQRELLRGLSLITHKNALSETIERAYKKYEELHKKESSDE